MKKSKYKIESAENVELEGEFVAQAEEKIEEAEAELEGTRVSFRWGKAQVEMLKEVAALMGVPYQTYVKMVLFRQARADLQNFHLAGYRGKEHFSPASAQSVDLTGAIIGVSAFGSGGVPIMGARVIGHNDRDK